MPLVAVLTALSLVPIWSVTYFPSQNGPWWVLIVKMFRDFHDPTFNYADFYRVNWHPVPYLLHNAICYSFSLFMPVLAAQKAAVSVYAVLLPLSVFCFLATVNKAARPLGYFSFLMVFNYCLLRGYHGFALGIPIGLFAFTYWIRTHQQLTVWRVMALNLLVVLTYFTHIFAFLALGLSILVYTLCETRHPWQVLRTLLVCFVPTGVLFLEYVHYNYTSSEWLQPNEITYHPLHWTVQEFFREMFYSFSVPVCLIAMAVLALAWYPWLRQVLSWLAARGRSDEAPAVNIGLMTLMIVLCAGVFVVPYKFLGWHHVNTRFVPLAIIISLGSAGACSRGWFPRVFVTAAIVGSIASFTSLAIEMRRIDQTLMHDYVEGISKIERNKKMLVVRFENPRIGMIRPLTRAHEYYHIAKGGANGQGVAQFNTIVSLVYRDYPIGKRFPQFHQDCDAASMARIANSYDYVLFVGDNQEQIQRFRRKGFELLYRNRLVQIYRNGARLAAG